MGLHVLFPSFFRVKKMNSENFHLAESLVDKSYVQQASQARRRREKMIRDVLTHVCLMFASSIYNYVLPVLIRKCRNVYLGLVGMIKQLNYFSMN